MPEVHYRGRVRQIPVYIRKFFRIFIYMDDWKVLPMSALIAWLVSFAIGGSMFANMEGTLKGSLALTCVCIWNGFFNSIQAVCRERGVLKREHRAGLHMSSYIAAHMVYQAAICLAQAMVTVAVCRISGLSFPSSSVFTGFFMLDIAIVFFLITYSADMMALFVSSMAHSTTQAMTLMPFILIFELLFSGGVFALDGFSDWLSYITIARWGMCAIAAVSGYNSLPMVTAWNQMKNMQEYEYSGMYPIRSFVENIEMNGSVDDFCYQTASYNLRPEYASTAENISTCLSALIIFSLVFAFLAVVVLEKIDKDRR